MTLEQTLQLADEGVGPRTREIIDDLIHQIRELQEYLQVVRVAHTIGFKLVPYPDSSRARENSVGR